MLFGSHASSLQAAPPTFDELVQSSEGAWSLKKINPDYSGSCIQVQRSSDNTTQDIGFSSGEIDMASVLSFCGSDIGYVKIWYDQSGNGRDLSNTSTSLMPRVCNAGSAYTLESGEYGLWTDGSSRLATTNHSWIEGTAYTVSVVVQFASTTASSQYAGTAGTGNQDALQLGNNYLGKLGIGHWNDDHNSTTILTTNVTQVHTNLKKTSAGSTIYVDGTSISDSTTKPANMLATTATDFAVFAGASSKYLTNGGMLGEVIAFNSALSATDRETLWDTQITNWNV